MVLVAKNLYTRRHIYAKRALIMYKYTVVTACLRGVNSTKILQARTIFGVFGAVFGHREGRESNNILQNRGVRSLFLPLFPALTRTVFWGVAMVILVLAMVITFLMTIASEKMVVFGWVEKMRFRHRNTQGGRTDKL